MTRKKRIRKKAPVARTKISRVALSADQVQVAIWQYLINHKLTPDGKDLTWQLHWSGKLGPTPPVEITITASLGPEP